MKKVFAFTGEPGSNSKQQYNYGITMASVFVIGLLPYPWANSQINEIRKTSYLASGLFHSSSTAGLFLLLLVLRVVLVGKRWFLGTHSSRETRDMVEIIAYYLSTFFPSSVLRSSSVLTLSSCYSEYSSHCGFV